MLTKIKSEPAVVTSALVAIVGAAATLGIIGTDQQAQIVAVITALVPLVGGLIVRANVTPNAKAKPVTVIGSIRLNDHPVTPAMTEPTTPEPAPEPEPAPAPAPEDPVKAALKSAIENVRATSNNTNDARAAAAVAAVDASA